MRGNERALGLFHNDPAGDPDPVIVSMVHIFGAGQAIVTGGTGAGAMGNGRFSDVMDHFLYWLSASATLFAICSMLFI